MRTLEEYAKEAFAALADARDADAAALLEEATRAFPERPRTYHFLGVARARLGAHDAAKRAFERALELFGDDHEEAWRQSLTELGNLLEECGEPRSALDCFQRILADALDPDALYNAGSVCQSSGRWEDARGFYLRLLELRPDDAQARYNVAATFVEEGRFSEALGLFQALSSAEPADEHLQLAVEHCLEQLGREDEARRHRLYRMNLAVPRDSS